MSECECVRARVYQGIRAPGVIVGSDGDGKFLRRRRGLARECFSV